MNAKILMLARRLGADDRGLTTVEYVIVLCLIAALAVASWKEFGVMIEDKLGDAHNEISDSVVIE